jgi:hypothetical protein
MMNKKRLDDLRNHKDHDVIYNEDLSELVAEVDRLRSENSALVNSTAVTMARLSAAIEEIAVFRKSQPQPTVKELHRAALWCTGTHPNVSLWLTRLASLQPTTGSEKK